MLKPSSLLSSSPLSSTAATTTTSQFEISFTNQIHSQTPPKCQNPNCSNHNINNSNNNYNITKASQELLFKSCHYCYTFYCSRACRQNDWPEHKSTKCLYGRTHAFCKRILTKVGRHCVELRAEISKLARAAFVSTCETRGFVWLDFASSDEAQQFLYKPLNACKLSNFLFYFGDNLLPKYVCYKASEHDENENDVSLVKQLFADYSEQTSVDLSEFKELCRTYDPRTELILLVSIKMNDEVRSAEVTPRKNVLKTAYVVKFMKMKLYFGQEKGVYVKETNLVAASPQLTQSLLPDDSDLPPTLILTSLKRNDTTNNDSMNTISNDEDRELFMANLLNEFQMRGIKIREKYPTIYRNLCLYVDENRPFTPCCLFPRDLTTNNLFMCLIMPNTEPTNYAWLYENEVRNEFNDCLSRGTIVTSSQINDENKCDDEAMAAMATNVKNSSFNLSQYLWIR